MPHTPLTGWVDFREIARMPAATFHSTRECPRIRPGSHPEGPQLIGHARRIRGLVVCDCVPDRGVYPEHWKRQGRTFWEW
jgi:hypothetical protein